MFKKKKQKPLKAEARFVDSDVRFMTISKPKTKKEAK